MSSLCKSAFILGLLLALSAHATKWDCKKAWQKLHQQEALVLGHQQNALLDDPQQARSYAERLLQSFEGTPLALPENAQVTVALKSKRQMEVTVKLEGFEAIDQLTQPQIERIPKETVGNKIREGLIHSLGSGDGLSRFVPSAVRDRIVAWLHSKEAQRPGLTEFADTIWKYRITEIDDSKKWDRPVNNAGTLSFAATKSFEVLVPASSGESTTAQGQEKIFLATGLLYTKEGATDGSNALLSESLTFKYLVSLPEHQGPKDILGGASLPENIKSLPAN